MGKFAIICFIGAALALGLGAWLGRRIRVDAPWRRLLALSIASLVLGAAGAGVGVLVQSPFPNPDAPPNAITGAAVMLIGMTLAWFGALLCGVAWADWRRALAPQPPAVDPDATLTPPPPAPPERQASAN